MAATNNNTQQPPAMAGSDQLNLRNPTMQDTMGDSELGPSQRELVRQVGYQQMMGSVMEGGEGAY